MIRDTAVVIDSAAYLPQVLIDRHGVFIAPLSVELDGEEYLEGVDITPDEFYQRIGDAKSVSTSQPSIGRLIECYQRAAADGAKHILSIHIGANVSGTVQSAQLAAESSEVPVTVVDTGQASFAEGLCVMEAIEALEEGADLIDVMERVRLASAVVGNTFVVKALDLADRGGRLSGDVHDAVVGVPVMVLRESGMEVVAMAKSAAEAVNTMAEHVLTAIDNAPKKKFRVGVGHGAAPEIAAALRERLEGLNAVAEVIDYVVGPSMGSHTGPGTAGAVFIPRPVTP
ncbi:MAG: DegV family protein [Chloroflexi bacterium]|nr:DegV family protein [Chloroflexota bacterium]